MEMNLKYLFQLAHPKDKRCIITEISTDDGYMKDYMTLRILDKKVENNDCNEKVMNLNCILMITDELEVN